MIQWYDWVAATAVAYGMLIAFFSFPIVGAFLAYWLYELWITQYPEIREML